MSRRLAAALAVACTLFSSAAAEEPAATPARAIVETTEIEFVDTPLNEAVSFLQDLHNIRVELDVAGLKTAGVKEDEPVNLILSGVTLHSALNLLAGQVGADWKLEKDRIVIVPEVKKDGRRVSQAPLPARPLVNEKVTRALKGGTKLDLKETSLREALALIADLHDIPVIVDHRGLEARKIDPDTAVTYRNRKPEETLAAALVNLLTPLKLEAVTENEVLFVRPKPEKAANLGGKPK